MCIRDSYYLTLYNENYEMPPAPEAEGGIGQLTCLLYTSESDRNNSSHESKIIMITTYKDSLMENYNMGWDDFLSKPVDIDILIDRLTKLLATPQKPK